MILQRQETLFLPCQNKRMIVQLIAQPDVGFGAQGLQVRSNSFNELLLFCLQESAHRPNHT